MSVSNLINCLKTRGDDARRERDEALAELSKIYRLIQRHNQDGFIDSLSYCENLQRCFDLLNDKLDTMKEELKKISRQRDQLLEKLAEESNEYMDRICKLEKKVNLK
jgi:hypothetical protein